MIRVVRRKNTSGPDNVRSSNMITNRPSAPRQRLPPPRSKLAFVVAILLPLLLLGGCSRVDEKVSQIYTGASVPEVIQLLGRPDSAWGSVAGPEMVFIYKGRKTYSILFGGGPGMTFVLKVVEGELGGPGAVPLSEEIDVVVSGDRIDFRRKGR